MVRDQKTDGKDESVNRRKILQGMGAFGATTIGLNSMSQSSSANKYAGNVSDVSISDREKITEQIDSDEEFKRIKKEIESKGFKPRNNELQVKNSLNRADPDYKFAVLPFQKQESIHDNQRNITQATVVWQESVAVEEAEPSVVGGVLYTTTSNNSKKPERYEENYYISNGAVKKSEQNVTQQPEGESMISTASEGTCVELDRYCVDQNYSCLAIIAAGLGLGCNPITGGLYACVGAAFVEGAAWSLDVNCDICNEYEEVSTEQPLCGCENGCPRHWEG